MGNLFENQDQADSGEQSLDDAAGEELGDEAGLEDAEEDLNETRQEQSREESLEGTQGSNLSKDDSGKPCRRATDTGV